MKQKFNFVQRIKLNTRKFFSLKNINSVSMNVSPLVSVIIPVYNREKFINASIESVLNQTYKNIELIVIDDGSSDNTINILNGINDSRLRIYSQPNRGRSVARNFALNLAKGKYIAFLDSDDIYLPQKIQLQVDFLEKNKKYSVMYTSATCVGENGESLNFEYRASKSGWIYNDIAYFLPITVILPTVMFEKTVYLKVGGFDEFLHRFEDVDLWRKISKYYEFYAMNVVTCEIRTHNDNVIYNQNPETIIQNLERYVDKILNEDRKIYRANGLKKLYDYYIDAFLSVPRFYNFASQLKKLKKVRFP
jgi:glycosyltransferase involved in cell wall biosynthesis